MSKETAGRRRDRMYLSCDTGRGTRELGPHQYLRTPVLFAPVLRIIREALPESLFYTIRRTVQATAVDLERVLVGVKPVGSANLALHGANRRADEFSDASTAHTDHVVVALSGMHVLIEIAVAGQALLGHEAVAGQQVEIAIEGGAGDLDPLLLHGVEQGFRVDMVMLGVHLAEEVEPLGGHAVALATQDLEELVELGELCHWKTLCPPTLDAQSVNSGKVLDIPSNDREPVDERRRSNQDVLNADGKALPRQVGQDVSGPERDLIIDG